MNARADATELGRAATEPEGLVARLTARGIDPAALVCDENGTIVPPSRQAQSRLEPGAPDLAELPCILSQGKTHEHLAIYARQVIGQGNMGIVHLARQVPLRRDVAVKTLLHGDPPLEERCQVLREARVTGVLEHPNVVPVYMLGVDPQGVPVIVMKRIGGTPWSRLIDEPALLGERGETRDPLDFHLEVLMQVCNAVHYAHKKGILHRDLKPDNVMIGEFGEVYVLDWGLAVSLRPSSEVGLPPAQSITSVAGTPSYMPPEMVLADAARIAETSDVYLLGAILHEIVTRGEPRHGGSTMIETLAAAIRSLPVDYDDDVPAGLAAICNRATACEPNDRYPSAEALRQAIAEYLHHRHSLQLAEEAATRLAPLRELLCEAGAHDEQSAAEIYRRYGECRFGFRQAQREWAENALALSGLCELCELMAGYEIEARDYKAAKRLVSERAELGEPSAELCARLELLREELEAEQAAVENLKSLGRRVDKSIGRRERALIMVAMGIIWTAMYFGLGWATRSGAIRATHATFLLVNTSYGAFLFVAMRVWRRTLWETEVNKRFLWTLWAAFLAGAALWPAALLSGIPFPQAIAITMLLYATVVWMSAAAVEQRLAWASIPYLCGFVAALAWPGYAWESIGLATLGAMATAASVWRPQPSGNSSGIASDPPPSHGK